MYFNNIFKNKKVLITGHTGFKGSWLSLWLTLLGAKVYGVSLYNPSPICHYELIKSKLNHKSYITDINDFNNFNKIVKRVKPDFVFHLAAQALVKKSYKETLNTLNTNSLGTANVLEAVKYLDKKVIVVMITSDKCYLDQNFKRGYREDDLLGGYDPYSASKAMAENVIFTYYQSFFKNNKQFKIGIGRAGNVIGGGDWAENRLVPDIFSNYYNNKKINIKNPNSTRPWQHVLEPLSGYLTLASNLYFSKENNGEPFNFGPKIKNSITVKELIKMFIINEKNLNFLNKKYSDKIKETKLLSLNCSKAKKRLGWIPCLNMKQTVKFTHDWYFEFYKNKNIFILSRDQIKQYMNIANAQKLIWTQKLKK
tara:strand:+ start:3994 stop:5094 length:1101 start_codon:yes stop_codon:yes gene_type:complete